MKKIIISICTISFILLIMFYYNFSQYEQQKMEVIKFNNSFLEYDKQKLYGTDITTVINKAIDNNEQYKIKKNESGIYIADDTYSTKIYINLEEEGSTYPMESLYKVSIKDFTSYFGELNFKCTKINYHKNGRISEMFFQATNY